MIRVSQSVQPIRHFIQVAGPEVHHVQRTEESISSLQLNEVLFWWFRSYIQVQFPVTDDAANVQFILDQILALELMRKTSHRVR